MDLTVRRRAPEALSPTFVLLFVALGAAINVVANYAATLAGLPIFLDTIGTAIVALVLGPWWGALTAVITAAALVPISGPANLLFSVVGVGAALTWGYGVRRLGLGRSASRYFVLNLLVVLVVSLLATPLVLYVFGGATGHPSDLITAAISGLGPVGAVFVDNILVNLVDKPVSGYLALAVASALPPHLIAGAELPGSSGNRWVIIVLTGLLAVGVLFAAFRAIGV